MRKGWVYEYDQDNFDDAIRMKREHQARDAMVKALTEDETEASEEQSQSEKVP